MHLSPQIWEENGGASYSLNVAYLAPWGGRGNIMLSMLLNILLHFLLQNFFFPIFLLKNLGASYGPKNTVSV